jgi:hypothetical protein
MSRDRPAHIVDAELDVRTHFSNAYQSTFHVLNILYNGINKGHTILWLTAPQSLATDHYGEATLNVGLLLFTSHWDHSKSLNPEQAHRASVCTQHFFERFYL